MTEKKEKGTRFKNVLLVEKEIPVVAKYNKYWKYAAASLEQFNILMKEYFMKGLKPLTEEQFDCIMKNIEDKNRKEQKGEGD